MQTTNTLFKDKQIYLLLKNRKDVNENHQEFKYILQILKKSLDTPITQFIKNEIDQILNSAFNESIIQDLKQIDKQSFINYWTEFQQKNNRMFEKRLYLLFDICKVIFTQRYNMYNINIEEARFINIKKLFSNKQQWINKWNFLIYYEYKQQIVREVKEVTIKQFHKKRELKSDVKNDKQPNLKRYKNFDQDTYFTKPIKVGDIFDVNIKNIKLILINNKIYVNKPNKPQLQFERKEKIGGGTYGQVHRYRIIKKHEQYIDFKYVALKSFNSNTEFLLESKAIEQFRKRKKNCGIIPAIVVKPSYILMQMCDMTLYDWILSDQVPLYTIKNNLKMITETVYDQLVCLLSVDKSYIYTDLKPSNILIKTDNKSMNIKQLYLGDIGSFVPMKKNGESNYVFTYDVFKPQTFEDYYNKIQYIRNITIGLALTIVSRDPMFLCNMSSIEEIQLYLDKTTIKIFDKNSKYYLYYD